MNKRKRQQRICLIQNIIAPYRLPLFEELKEKFDLHVFFCKSKTRHRKWSTSLAGYRFKSEALKNFNMGLFIVNYTLPIKLLKSRYDAYLVGVNPMSLFASIFVLLVAKTFNRPFIIWSGGIDTEYPENVYGNNKAWEAIIKLYEKFTNFYRKILYRYADSFIAYGSKAKEFLIKRGVEEKRIFIGTQVVVEKRNEMVSVTKKDLGFEGKKVILFVGYFVKRKGIETLINAYKKMNRDDTVLVIAGAGKEENKLKSLAADREDICFPGYVSGKEKVKYYSVADVFVLPTFHDAWAQVINEAMFYGLPIITTEEDGSSGELVRDNGFIVKAGDEGALGGALETLLNDEKLRKEMSRKSKEYIRHYDINYAVRCFEDAINFAIKVRNKCTSRSAK